MMKLKTNKSFIKGQKKKIKMQYNKDQIKKKIYDKLELKD
jgi:hypothetical protein